MLAAVTLSGQVRAQAPAPPDCEAERCNPAVQAAVTDCGCDTAENHGKYVSCVARAVNGLAKDRTIDRQCKGKIKRCAARSTCGKDNFETCTRGQTCVNGTCANANQACAVDTDCPTDVKCSVKRIAPPPTPDRCVANGGTTGSGSCCASCP
jgi:hypothetical protein